MAAGAKVTKDLARALRSRAGNFLLVLTADYEQLDFVFFRVGGKPEAVASNELIAPALEALGFRLKEVRRKKGDIDFEETVASGEPAGVRLPWVGSLSLGRGRNAPGRNRRGES